jgi:hypothetical protein
VGWVCQERFEAGAESCVHRIMTCCNGFLRRVGQRRCGESVSLHGRQGENDPGKKNQQLHPMSAFFSSASVFCCTKVVDPANDWGGICRGKGAEILPWPALYCLKISLYNPSGAQPEIIKLREKLLVHRIIPHKLADSFVGKTADRSPD